MKSILHITLLLLAVFFVTSCKTNQDQVMKDYYNKVNKHSVIENRLISDNNIGGQSTPLRSQPASANLQRTYNASSERAYQEQVISKSNEYKVLYDDSEIANGDVYREAAAHRQKLINDCNCGTTKTSVANTASASTTATPVASATPAVTTSTPPAVTPAPVAPSPSTQQTQTPKVEENQSPAIFAHLLDAEKRPIRRVRVRFIDESDQNLLKQYSVIIATLSKPAGVERLKKAFATSNDHLFFVKNEVGLYYAIIGSYDTESEASQKIRRVQMEYTNLYTSDQLFNRYGITFADMWILRK